MTDHSTTAGAVVALLESLADLPYGGEAVDQRAHALLTAGHALAAGADDELVVAAALHDVGRAREVARAYPGVPHEEAGAAWCAPLFGPRVAWLVGAHVPAKRYLAATDAEHRAGLSPVSVRSLAIQGGPMATVEAVRFAAHPWAADAVLLRRWDDGAKDPATPHPSPTDLFAVVERVLR